MDSLYFIFQVGLMVLGVGWGINWFTGEPPWEQLDYIAAAIGGAVVLILGLYVVGFNYFDLFTGERVSNSIREIEEAYYPAVGGLVGCALYHFYREMWE